MSVYRSEINNCQYFTEYIQLAAFSGQSCFVVMWWLLYITSFSQALKHAFLQKSKNASSLFKKGNKVSLCACTHVLLYLSWSCCDGFFSFSPATDDSTACFLVIPESKYFFVIQVDNIILLTDSFTHTELDWALNYAKEINNQALLVKLYMSER